MKSVIGEAIDAFGSGICADIDQLLTAASFHCSHTKHLLPLHPQKKTKHTGAATELLSEWMLKTCSFLLSLSHTHTQCPLLGCSWTQQEAFPSISASLRGRCSNILYLQQERAHTLSISTMSITIRNLHTLLSVHSLLIFQGRDFFPQQKTKAQQMMHEIKQWHTAQWNLIRHHIREMRNCIITMETARHTARRLAKWQEKKRMKEKYGGRRTGNIGLFKDMCLSKNTDRIEREDAEYSQLCNGCLKHWISIQSSGVTWVYYFSLTPPVLPAN